MPAPRTSTPASPRRIRSRPANKSQLFIRVFPFCTAGVEPDFGQVPTPRRERTVRVLDRNDSNRFWNRVTSVSVLLIAPDSVWYRATAVPSYGLSICKELRCEG